jgi:hypothetical protein
MNVAIFKVNSTRLASVDYGRDFFSYEIYDGVKSRFRRRDSGWFQRALANAKFEFDVDVPLWEGLNLSSEILQYLDNEQCVA